MKFSPFHSSVKGSTMKSGLFAACLLAATSLITALPTAQIAFAGDLDPQVEDVSESRFVRMGLNKSIVVKLPAEARDVIVGNEDIVDAVVRRKNMAYLFARNTGQTNIFFLDADGNQILSLDLEVSIDTLALKKILSRALPGNRITVDIAGNNIMLGGVARNASEANKAVVMANAFAYGVTQKNEDKDTVLNTMTVEGEDQVMLKVKVVEVQRNVLKEFGVDFSAMLSLGKLAVNLASVPIGLSALNTDSGQKTTYANGNVRVESLIRAMEGDGLLRTLAEPNLTAMTGQPAEFFAGGELLFVTCTKPPVVVVCEDKYKPYGVEVKFTPTVLSEDRIVLNIDTSVSEPARDGSFSKRATKTTLELPSGGSMMVAGLISESVRQNLDATPGLKKLPVLGSLFRSTNFRHNETELVIIVTPILVRPTSQLNTPDKGYIPPGDAEAVFMGRINKVYGNGTGAGQYNGNVGFIVQ